PRADDAPAARRRRTPTAGALGVVLVLVLAGVLFVANARLQGGEDARHAADLPSLVQVELDRADELATEVDGLRAEVDELTDAVTEQNPIRSSDQQILVEIAAGRTPLTGPGITVELTDAPTNRPQPDWVVNDDLVIHQQDLQAVINALWAGGAEAMTLQDQRVISTTAFRCVGNVLLLHGRHYSPPYVVQAIGDPEQLEEALYASRSIQVYLDYVENVGLGWEVENPETVEVPAFEGSLELRHANLPEGTAVFPLEGLDSGTVRVP
uniref:DUF881 domain-containing protein n=1 Tax=Actinotalea sp. C106 TaxID=2908644 RepID=UPI0027E1753C